MATRREGEGDGTGGTGEGEGDDGPPPTPGEGDPPVGDGDGGGEPNDAISGSAKDDNIVQPADFPENWRLQMSGGDEKAAAQLDRYENPAAVAKAMLAGQQKIRSGELTQTLSEDATDDEKAEWRNNNGVPESADGYLSALPDGRVIGENDKSMVDDFTAAAFEGNMTQKDVNTAIEWWFATEENVNAARVDRDNSQKQATEDAQRAAWGNEFRPNVNRITALGEVMPAGVWDQMRGGRLADGTLFMNDPNVLGWMLTVAKEFNPGGIVLPNDSGDASKGIDGRLSEINSMMMGPDRQEAYWKNEPIQKEYRELLDAKEKMSKKGK